MLRSAASYSQPPTYSVWPQLFPSRHSSPGCQASITTSSMISKLQEDRFQAKQKDDNSFVWSPLSFLGICILPISIWKYIYDSSFDDFKMIYFVVCLIIELKLYGQNLSVLKLLWLANKRIFFSFFFSARTQTCGCRFSLLEG